MSTRHTVVRAAAIAALGFAGLTAIAGTASADPLLPEEPQGSTDPADYTGEGVESADQPEQPYFDGGPVTSGIETVYGFVGAPADGLLGGNLPIPHSQDQTG